MSVKCKSGFGLVVLLPCVWNVCKAHTGMIRMGITWRSPRRKENPGAFFWAHELGNWPYLTVPVDLTDHVGTLFFLASAGVGGWLMDDGCQSIPRPWLNAYSHTHSLRGKSERERYLWESTCYIHSRFFPSFLGISLLCALPERSLLFVRPIIVVALGLGWAGRLGRLTDGSFFFVFSFFHTGDWWERKMCQQQRQQQQQCD